MARTKPMDNDVDDGKMMGKWWENDGTWKIMMVTFLIAYWTQHLVAFGWFWDYPAKILESFHQPCWLGSWWGFFFSFLGVSKLSSLLQSHMRHWGMAKSDGWKICLPHPPTVFIVVFIQGSICRVYPCIWWESHCQTCGSCLKIKSLACGS